MKKRSLLLSVVMFSVCIMPATSLALSLNNWTKYIQAPSMSFVSQLADSEIAKKLSLVTLLASLVVYYYWTNKKDNNVNGEVFDIASKLKSEEDSMVPSEESSVIVSSDIRKYFSVPVQFPVVHQSEEYGGPASCGYHTVLNALELVKLKIAGKNDKELRESLMKHGDEKINTYFGKNGIWRKFIIDNRKRVEVKRLLQESLKKCFVGKDMEAILVSCLSDDAFTLSLNTLFSDDLWNKYKTQHGVSTALRGFAQKANAKLFLKKLKIAYMEKLPASTWSEKNPNYIQFMVIKASDLYKSMLVNFAGFIANILSDFGKSSDSYNFTNIHIKEILRYELDKISSDKTAGFIHVLKQDRLLSNVIDFNLMRRELLLDSKIETMAGIVDKVLEVSDRKHDFNGEWLDAQEVASLWEHAMQDPEFVSMKDVWHCFRAIPSFEVLGKYDTVVPDCRESRQSALNQELRSFTIIGMGSMKQLSDTQVEDGHWYPLVMEKSSDGRSQNCYVMDSMGKDRTSDQNVLKIIKLIEQ